LLLPEPLTPPKIKRWEYGGGHGRVLNTENPEVTEFLKRGGAEKQRAIWRVEINTNICALPWLVFFLTFAIYD